jgi:GT2 family glycosyltransferase
MSALSIGITTRDRPQSLEACLRSIAVVLGTDHDVMVFDDGSAQAVEPLVRTLDGLDVRVFRSERSRGTLVGRNRLVKEARHEIVLLLDDDTLILYAGAVWGAAEVLAGDFRVGAVALAQAERDGRPWPAAMQPALAQRPCVIPAFIGFAHILKRTLFLELGGYRERLVFYGEEKEFCLRLLARGHLVVYLPDALVAHVPDPGTRDARRYIRHAIRNDCLSSLYNEPLPMAAAALPVRLLRHRAMARGLTGGDPGGLRWIVKDLVRELPAVVRGRRSVGWRVMREWRRLKTAPRYLGPIGGATTT